MYLLPPPPWVTISPCGDCQENISGHHHWSILGNAATVGHRMWTPQTALRRRRDRLFAVCYLLHWVIHVHAEHHCHFIIWSGHNTAAQIKTSAHRRLLLFRQWWRWWHPGGLRRVYEGVSEAWIQNQRIIMVLHSIVWVIRRWGLGAPLLSSSK